MTRQTDANAALKTAGSRFDTVDVLINNAGYGIVGAFEETSNSELRALVETNLFGAINVNWRYRRCEAGYRIELRFAYARRARSRLPQTSLEHHRRVRLGLSST